MHRIERKPWAVAVAVGFGAALIIFLIWPQTDLRVTGLFYVEGTGFPAQSSAALSMLRHGIWNLSMSLAVVAIVGGVAYTLWRHDLFGVPGGRWQFVALLYILGPGILVNAILKNYWGRARPDQIVDFGGSALFSPAWVMADQCARNCSFVSGEGSGAAALVIGGVVVLQALRDHVSERVLVAAQVFLATAAVTAAALRVILGRHFLSDTIFATLLVALIALLLWPIVKRGGFSLRRKS
jgi:lipid A 4'-phosphatase